MHNGINNGQNQSIQRCKKIQVKKKPLHIYFLNQINRHHKLNLITERKKQENIQGKEDKHKRRTKNGSGIEGRTIGPSKSLLTREMLGHTSKIISNFTFTSN